MFWNQQWKTGESLEVVMTQQYASVYISIVTSFMSSFAKMDGIGRTERGLNRKEGYVSKRAPDGICLFRWNKRYLQQRRDFLCYFEDKEACFNEKPGKTIDLRGCIEVKKEEPLEDFDYIFSIQTSNEWSSKGRKFLISANSDEDREEWIKCITMAVEIESQESKTEDSSGKRRNTTTSADSGVGSLSEVALEAPNDAAIHEEEIEGSESVKEPTENDECSKDTHKGRSSEDDMAPQPRPRSNEVMTNRCSISCPTCGTQIDIYAEKPQGRQKKPSESDIRNCTKNIASEGTDCERDAKHPSNKQS